MHETFISLNYHMEEVVTLKGAKNVYGQSHVLQECSVVCQQQGFLSI